MGKSLHAGKAAMDGLLSGFLARDGFTSATEPIEGHRGFLHLFSPDPIPARAAEGLGDTWYLPRDGFKPYACGSLTHPPAQALLELRAEHAPTAADIAGVDAYVHDYVKTTTGLAEPRTGLEGKFSIYHAAPSPSPTAPRSSTSSPTSASPTRSWPGCAGRFTSISTRHRPRTRRGWC
jgi:2-methylcitrate dehydratase PrpD